MLFKIDLTNKIFTKTFFYCVNDRVKLTSFVQELNLKRKGIHTTKEKSKDTKVKLIPPNKYNKTSNTQVVHKQRH